MIARSAPSSQDFNTKHNSIVLRHHSSPCSLTSTDCDCSLDPALCVCLLRLFSCFDEEEEDGKRTHTLSTVGSSLQFIVDIGRKILKLVLQQPRQLFSGSDPLLAHTMFF